MLATNKVYASYASKFTRTNSHQNSKGREAPGSAIVSKLKYESKYISVFQGFIPFRLIDLAKYRKYKMLRGSEGVYYSEKNGVPSVTRMSAFHERCEFLREWKYCLNRIMYQQFSSFIKLLSIVSQKTDISISQLILSSINGTENRPIQI